MTAKEEDIVKHHVNCGTPKNRLTQFIRGMDSIESKVHPVLLLSAYNVNPIYCIIVAFYKA